jgi:hypothetical protein
LVEFNKYNDLNLRANIINDTLAIPTVRAELRAELTEKPPQLALSAPKKKPRTLEI